MASNWRAGRIRILRVHFSFAGLGVMLSLPWALTSQPAFLPPQRSSTSRVAAEFFVRLAGASSPSLFHRSKPFRRGRFYFRNEVRAGALITRPGSLRNGATRRSIGISAEYTRGGHLADSVRWTI